MIDQASCPATAFIAHRLLASGRLGDVALAVKAAEYRGDAGPVLVFDDRTGRIIDLDLRGSAEEIVARLEPPVSIETPGIGSRGRGRPKLGVIGREVTLLPRHWEWLGRQPGGASVALRKLVDEARRNFEETGDRRDAREAAYHFMMAIAGDFAGFEEASRALFAGNRERFAECTAAWPADVRIHAERLAFGSQPDKA